MTEAIALDVVPLGEPAHADMFVPVSADDVLLVVSQEEGGQQGGMAEDETPARRVFVGDDLVARF